MGTLKFFTNSVLLITTPSLLAYPQECVLRETIPAQKVNLSSDEENILAGPNYLLSYDEIMDLLDGLESGALEEKCSLEELEGINQFLAHLAEQGAFLDDSEEYSDLENDIAALLSPEDDVYTYVFSSGETNEYIFIPAVYDGKSEIVLCKSWIKRNWEKTKKFAKKHKKEIIIGAAVVVAVTVVVVAVAATSAGAAAAAAGAAGAATSGKKEKTPNEHSASSMDNPAPEAPILKEAIDEHVSSFKEFASEDVIIQSSDAHRDPSFGEKARELGSILAHETLEGISEIASVIPQLGEELKELGSRILPRNILPPNDNNLMGSPKENYENFIAKGHEVIDQAFSTNQAEQYTSEAKANDPLNDFTIGLLPPPGNYSKGPSVAKFRKVVEAGKETAVLAEELGFTAKEIAYFERAGTLEETVISTYENLVNKPAMLESIQKSKYAREFLAPYSGKYMPELQIRELIHEAGIRTFPRPKGLPESFRVKLSDKGAGMKYVHPKNEGTYVRAMPGIPHSPNPSQQRPYINHRINGRSLDKFGNFVPNKSPEAHIPIEEFIYRNK